MLKRFSLLALTLLLVVGCFAQSQNGVLVGTYPQATSILVTTVGTPGTTVWCYWVVSIYTGGKSAPAGPACTAQANATLSATNYDVVTFSAPSGTQSAPTGYDLLRTPGTVSPIAAQLGLGAATGGAGNVVAGGFISSTPPTTATQVGGASLPGSVSTNQSGSPLNDQSNTTSAYTVSTATAFAYTVLDPISAAVPQLETWVSTGGAPLQIGSSITGVQSVEISPTVASLATGVVAVAALTGHTMKVVGATIQPIGGAVATCTDIRVEDSGFANDVFRFLVSGTLSQNVVYNEASASTIVTVGTGTAFGTAFGSGLGIGVKSTGSTCGTATSVNVRILYKVL